ncbi:stage II sporulation protein M [Halobacteria archaeon AArc-dxtr1]|nr:stage II sporulation protein M [Halobacteria archaeon AArc-dxtr1]
MRLSHALSSVARALRSPGEILPFYVLGMAVPVIVRTLPFLALGVVWLYLEASGRLDRLREELAALETQPPDPEADPDAFFDWTQDVAGVFEIVFTPGVVGVLALSVLAAVLVGVGIYAVVAAGQIAACFGQLRAQQGLLAGVVGARRFWLSFLGLLLLELFLWIAVTAVLGIGAAIVAGLLVLATDSALLAAPVVLLAALFWIAAAIGIRALFAFAPVAVVVDDSGVFASLSASFRFIRANPVDALFYYVVALLGVIGVGGLLSALTFLGVGSLGSLLSALLVLPALDLLKTTLYGAHRGTIGVPPAPESRLRSQFVGGIRHGVGEMVTFVRSTPGIHGFVAAVGIGTFVLGWIAAAPLAEVFEASIAQRIEDIIPPQAALEFFGNNWTVALTTAFGGLAFAIPAVVSIAFNGVVIGATARLEVEPIELLAFVIPHGIFEIPAIFIAGAVGVYLGIVGWRAVRGRADAATLADALGRSFWVLVGVGVVLAVAGFIEGFVSPYYYQPFL